MKRGVIIVSIILIALFVVAMPFVNDVLAPLFLNSRIERLNEKGLPKIMVENGNIYCRMKADDFRFPLPLGSRAVSLIVTGGFDTVDGSVVAEPVGTNELTMFAYKSWLSGQVPVGGNVTSRSLSDGRLLIEFHYFGDR